MELAIYQVDAFTSQPLTAYQASARGGYVKIVLLPKGRIKIIGQAITVLNGNLCL